MTLDEQLIKILFQKIISYTCYFLLLSFFFFVAKLKIFPLPIFFASVHKNVSTNEFSFEIYSQLYNMFCM